jgi:tetratricopeptide (TPR) repeat protein
MKKTLIAAVLLLPVSAVAQDAAEVQRLFEAGQYQRVVESAGPEAAPEVQYTLAQSHQRLGALDQAREVYGQLGERPESDPWHFIGLSGSQLLNEDTDAALASAQQATAVAGGLADAHFQLGLVLAKRQQWAPAAAAFERVLQIDPANAYAHYYGGLMQYRANRPDRMGIHFEQFLKLAPDAPERPEVLQIMRTIRGR